MNELSPILDLIKDIVTSHRLDVDDNYDLRKAENKNFILLLTAAAVGVKNYRLTTGDITLDADLSKIRNRLVHIDNDKNSQATARRYNKIVLSIKDNYSKENNQELCTPIKDVWSPGSVINKTIEINWEE